MRIKFIQESEVIDQLEWDLESLRQNATKWIEVQRLPNVIEKTRYPLISLWDSHVLLGREGGNGTQHLCRDIVQREWASQLSAAGSVDFRQQNLVSLACTRISNDTYVALTSLT